MITEPMKLARMRPARGLWVMRRSGMIGSATRDSVYKKSGKHIVNMTREVRTNGWDHGKIFPPRFYVDPISDTTM